MTSIIKYILRIIIICIIIIMCTAGRKKVSSRCKLLAGGVRAALFILQLLHQTAERRSEEGCSPLITASVINSFTQTG